MLKIFALYVFSCILLIGVSSCNTNNILKDIKEFAPENYKSYYRILEMVKNDSCYDNDSLFLDCINGMEEKLKNNQSIVLDGMSVEEFVDSLDTHAFNSVWKTSIGKYRDAPFKEMKPTVFLQYNHQYVEYLTRCSSDYFWLKEYLDLYHTMKTITPSMFKLVIENNSSIDFSNPNINLIVIIHYITLFYKKPISN